MKKVFVRSLITALILNTVGAVMNLVSFWSNGTFLLAQQLNGGECMEWRGFGLLLTKIVPIDPIHAPNASISLDVPSLFVTLAIGFILGFIILLIIHLVNTEKKDSVG